MPTRRAVLGGIACATLAVAGCSARSAESHRAMRQTSLDAATAAQIDTAVTDAMSTAAIPGALIGIWSPQGDYVKAFGVADTATGAPMKADFYSRIGSVTKTFTATAVLQLVDRGTVGLDDPIAHYVEGVPNGQTITVRQLADMRSGLADYTKTDAFASAIIANPQRHFTPDELLAWAFDQPADFPPGQRVQYCNTNYILLGLLVEKVSGRPFADYLTGQILSPLDLAHTSLPSGNQFPEPHPHGYTASDDGGPPVDATTWTTSFAWAAGAMISTLEDMRIWVPALATGELLSPGLQQQRLRTASEPGAADNFGYGMGIFRAGGWIGHNGSVPGYQTVAVYLPQRKITLVAMINTDIASPGRADPSEIVVTAITSVLTPEHVYQL